MTVSGVNLGNQLISSPLAGTAGNTGFSRIQPISPPASGSITNIANNPSADSVGASATGGNVPQAPTLGGLLDIVG